MDYRYTRPLLVVSFLVFFLGTLFLGDSAVAQVSSPNLSVFIEGPVPQFSLVATGTDSFEVRWDWDYKSPGYFPPLISEMQIEISDDGINYTHFEVRDANAFSVSYTNLSAGIYFARITIIDGNNYDYVVGPIPIEGSTERVILQENTDVTIRGLAYPGPSTLVFFSHDGGSTVSIVPVSDGSFSYQTASLPSGSVTLSLRAQDPNGLLSSPVKIPVTVPLSAPLLIDDIALPPTIHLSASVVVAGEMLEVSGYAYKSGSLAVVLSGLSSSAYLLTANSDGSWSISLDTEEFIAGYYEISVQSTSQDLSTVSPFSDELVFQVLPALAASSVCGDGVLETPEECDDGGLINGDGCSSTCKSEVLLPESVINQPTPSVFPSSTVDLSYSASSPNATVDFVKVYYSLNAADFLEYPERFTSGVIQLTGLVDGNYEVYSRAMDTAGVFESAPLVADASFTIDNGLNELVVVAYPEKRKPPIGNWSLPFVLTLNDTVYHTEKYRFDFVTDDLGTITLDPVSVSLQPGVYDYVLKGLSHLSRRLDSVPYSGQDLFLDFTDGGTFFLRAGDVNLNKDDKVNILDLVAMTLVLNTDDLNSDLNADLRVNSLDFAIATENFNQTGDGF